MERPSSRGSLALSSGGVSKAPTGIAVAQPERPMSAARQQPAGRPGTGSRQSNTGSSIAAVSVSGSIMGPPPGTAVKRQGTTNAPPGTASRSNVQVDNRPITHHGVTGLKTAATGQGRQVLDRNYFLSELRQRRQEIVQVISGMQDEINSYEQKSKKAGLMEKRQADLAKDVKLLQETLTDFNMVLDKIGSQTSISSINSQYLALKERNNLQQKRVDDILTQRLGVEQRTRQVEGKILDIQQTLDSKLSSLPPSSRQQYQELQAERLQLVAESGRMEDALLELDRALQAAEEELARNPMKQRALQMQEQIKVVTERKYEMAAEEEKSRATPEEQREALLAKIKRDNAEIDRSTTQIKELQEQIKRIEARLGTMGGARISNAAAVEDDPGNRQKFDELLAKEREMSLFIDSFPSRRAERQGERSSREDAIVAALERISKLESLSKAVLPSKQSLRELQDELDYKKVQLQSTQATQEQLKEQLEQRRAELERASLLEDHICQELPKLAEKEKQLRQELQKFEHTDDVKRGADDKKQQLDKQKAALLKRKDLLKVTVAEKGWKHQAKKAQLQENSLHITLDKLEQKLRAQQQATFQASEVIKAKESEMNYQKLAGTVSALADELNGYVVRALH